jgi:drug/metabolite transporter (DMT)-like permease
LLVTTGQVAIVSPIIAATPLFSLVLCSSFLRKEKVAGKTILGTVAGVAGTIAIALGK